MRIVGGRLGGRIFGGPSSTLTRPTSDRVREAVASALESRNAIVGASVLDLFAGTGAYGFEALSRGATHATFIERDKKTASQIRQSARVLGVTEQSQVIAADLLRVGKKIFDVGSNNAGAPFGLLFIDPPYDRIEDAMTMLSALRTCVAVAAGAWVTVEHASRNPPAWPSWIHDAAAYRYGDTSVRIGRLSTDP